MLFLQAKEANMQVAITVELASEKVFKVCELQMVPLEGSVFNVYYEDDDAKESLIELTVKKITHELANNNHTIGMVLTNPQYIVCPALKKQSHHCNADKKAADFLKQQGWEDF